MCYYDQKNTGWANLHLYDYEAYIKTDKPGSNKFKNSSRFIDDECNLNDAEEFSKPFHIICSN